LSDDDLMSVVAKIIAEAEAERRETVELPTELAEALLKRAQRRPRISRGLRIREQGQVQVARLRKQKLIAKGERPGAAHAQAAEWLAAQFNRVGGSRPISRTTAWRWIEGPPKRRR